jgi:hypothetical protein
MADQVRSAVGMPFRSRVVVAVTAGVVAAGLSGGPALAHVEVKADKTQAGSKDVTLTFNGEAESSSAGIKSERVVLPAGLAPGDVTLVKAPTGWKFTTASDGFTIGGKALKVGQDAVFAVRLAQLPSDAPTLSFKTLETYGDGEVVRWIDLPQAGQPEPDHPAPTITIKGAVKGTPSSAAPSSPAGSPAASPAAEIAAPPTAGDARSTGSHAGLWTAVAVIVIIALTGLVLWRRRAGRTGPPSER